jgi:hypothetical protein
MLRRFNDLANLLDLSLHGLDLGQVRRCAVSKSKSGWLKIHRANWGRGPAHTHEPPIVPSAWEKMLREMQLNEAQVLAVLKDRKGDTAMRIVEFAHDNHEKAYVPTTILVRLGLSTW